MKRLFVLLLIVTGMIVTGTLAYAQNPKLSPELQDYTGTQPVQVIVQYAPGTQVTCTGLLGLLDCLVNDVLNLGGKIVGELPLINGVVAQLDGNGIQSLSNQSNVVYISPDRPLTSSLSNAAYAVNAPFAWQSNYTGDRHRRGADRQRREQSSGSGSGYPSALASRVSTVLRAGKLERQRSIRSRHSRRRIDRRRRPQFHWPRLQQDLQRNCPGRKHHQPASTGSEWRGHR